MDIASRTASATEVADPASALEAAIGALVERVVERKLAQRDETARYVSKERLAELYGLRERTIKTWRSKGLPGVRVGKEIMYDLDACDRWIEAHG